MFTEPHLGPEKIPRWWCWPISVLGPALLIFFLFGLVVAQCALLRA